jgi:tetratricopeptide (TPR) repeat protein
LELWAELQDKIGKVLVELRPPDAAAVFRRAIGVVDASAAWLKNARRIRGTLYLSLSRSTNDLPLALQYARKALEEGAAAALDSPSDASVQLLLSTTHTQVGWIHIRMEDPEPAVTHYETSIWIREKLARDHPNDNLYRRYLKLAYEHFASLEGNPERPNMGHPEIARLYYKKAQPLEEADLADPQNHLARYDYALFQLKLATVEVSPDELAESLVTLRQAARTFASLAAAEPGVIRYDHSLADTYRCMGNHLTKMERNAEAQVEYQRSLALYNRCIGHGLPDELVYQGIVAAERGIAMTLALSGNQEGALARARSVLQRIESAPGSAHALLGAEAYLTLAEVHQKFGDCNEATAAARRSIQIVKPSGGHGRSAGILHAAEGVIEGCWRGRP